MDTLQIDFELNDLLSQLVGQKLCKQDVSPPVVFMVAFLSMLVSVIWADSQVTDEEKQRWLATHALLASS